MTRRPRGARVVLLAHDVGGVGGMERVLEHHVRALSSVYPLTVVSCTLAPELRPLVHRWVRIRAPRSPVSLKVVVYTVLSSFYLWTRRPGRPVLSVGAVTLARVDMVALHFYHRDYVRAAGALANVGGSASRRLNTGLVRAMSLGLERLAVTRRRSPLVLPVSRGLELAFREDHPAIATSLVPNGVDADAFGPRLHHRPSAPLTALFVGGDWARKGVFILVEALALTRARGVDIRLQIVGRGRAEAVRERARELAVEAHLDIAEPTRNVSSYFRAADVFCLPSEYETFGLVAYEAAACALPVIATPVHGVEELLERGAGIRVERSAVAVADALVRLAGDEAARAEMGARGRACAQEYSWRKSSEALLRAVSSRANPC